MVTHSFVCDDCGTEVEDHTTRRIHRCPKCGLDMRWDVCIAIHGNYKHPIHSDALAVHPDQRAEHERTFPNIRLDGQNRPIFDNFVAHRDYLKKCNLVKIPKKIKNSKRLPTPSA